MRKQYIRVNQTYHRLTSEETLNALSNGLQAFVVCFSNGYQPRSEVFTSREPHVTTAIDPLPLGKHASLHNMSNPTRDRLRANGYTVQSTHYYADSQTLKLIEALPAYTPEVAPIKTHRSTAMGCAGILNFSYIHYKHAQDYIQYVVNNNFLSHTYMRSWHDLLWVAMPTELVPYALAIGRRVSRFADGEWSLLPHHTPTNLAVKQDAFVKRAMRFVSTAPKSSIYYMHVEPGITGAKELHYGIHRYKLATDHIPVMPDSVCENLHFAVSKTEGSIAGQVPSQFVRFAIDELSSQRMVDVFNILDYYARMGAPLYFRHVSGSGPYIQPYTAFEPVEVHVPLNPHVRQTKRAASLTIKEGEGTLVPFCFSDSTRRLYLQLLIIREFLRNMRPDCQSPYEAVLFVNTNIRDVPLGVVEDFNEWVGRDIKTGPVERQIKRQLQSNCEAILSFKVKDPNAPRGQFERLHLDMQGFIENWAVWRDI